MRGAQIALRLWLADGTPLINPARDPSVLQPMTPPIGDAVSFVVNRHEVMPGLEDGVRGMRPGGVRQLVIPSSAGFGPTGRMSVPPNAVLVAEVKLLMAAYDPVR
jgi:FKBP-type peptidyl-prolyl cis-trans isomerase 2